MWSVVEGDDANAGGGRVWAFLSFIWMRQMRQWD